MCILSKKILERKRKEKERKRKERKRKGKRKEKERKKGRGKLATKRGIKRSCSQERRGRRLAIHRHPPP